jgi:transposase InsO family protein
MNKYEERKQAISRYQAGEKVTTIISELGKSRRWFYNWLARYGEVDGENGWYEDRSRAPKTAPHKVSAEIEEQVIAARKKLTQKGIAQTGAIAISYELRSQGIEPPPVWTINRIIARHGLNKTKPIRRSTKDYPTLFLHTHQMDLVGPRWLKGGGRFYSVNIIDTMCRSCSVAIRRTKASVGIARALADFWTSHGMPDALQMDNELAFRGSNRYPRSFGVVVRLALTLGIAPVFIPVKEPWRNGIIERFNRTWDERFFRSQTFSDFKHLKSASREFATFHNAHHRYSALNHKTPDERAAQLLPPWLYDDHIDLEQRIPLEEGSIYFIRFIRSDCKLHLPTESFRVDKSLKYSYVIAEISVENHCLFIRQDRRIVQTMEYIMPADW